MRRSGAEKFKHWQNAGSGGIRVNAELVKRGEWVLLVHPVHHIGGQSASPPSWARRRCDQTTAGTLILNWSSRYRFAKSSAEMGRLNQ